MKVRLQTCNYFKRHLTVVHMHVEGMGGNGKSMSLSFAFPVCISKRLHLFSKCSSSILIKPKCCVSVSVFWVWGRVHVCLKLKRNKDLQQDNDLQTPSSPFLSNWIGVIDRGLLAGSEGFLLKSVN